MNREMRRAWRQDIARRKLARRVRNTQMSETKVTGIRFIATYQRVGDGEAKDWFDATMDLAVQNEEIWNHQLLTVERGEWGIEFLVFTIDVLLNDYWRAKRYDDVKEKGTSLLNNIIGDSDVEVLWVSPIQSKVVGS